MANEISRIKAELDKYTNAPFRTGSELYELPGGVFINTMEYEKEMDKLILQYKRAIRKKERGFEYVDSDLY